MIVKPILIFTLTRLWMGCVHSGSSECSPPAGSNSRDSSSPGEISPGEESVYSQIRPPPIPHTCPHGNNADLKERMVEEDFNSRQTGLNLN